MANRSYDKEAVEFLAQAENIEYVFEIVDRFEDVKNFLLQKFWNTLAHKLEEQIRGSYGWEVELHDPLKQNGGLWVWPPTGRDAVYLYPIIEQAWRISYGIHWDDDARVDVPKQAEVVERIPAVAQLRQWLTQNGFRHQDQWWLGLQRAEIQPMERSSIIIIARDDRLEDGLAAAFMQLFVNTHELLTQANQDIARAAQQGQLQL